MTSHEIRRSFLDFFKERGHTMIEGSALVLPTDPTLLFANAGMNQFKDIFLGVRESEHRRAANTQKCVRVSGKHNDLEEVGRDTYHHTFFEMLGNWSFGDYYKREAIGWAWELLTEVWKLPKDRLWATIYRDDDEAGEIWREVTDIDHDHILRFDEKDNFWEMGETGPCGPCSEIHIDLTPEGCNREDVNSGIPEVMELWNLVFIQYNRRSDGTLEDLPRCHVDTGMGFERLCAVLQGKKSNYDTDVFKPIIDEIGCLSGRTYEGEDAVAMRVIADHLRMLSFTIADGVLPSNEGRGYVLRRILRRAVRFGRNLGFREPFLGRLLPVLQDIMGESFPEIIRREKVILRTLKAEEESFSLTLDRGLALFDKVVSQLIEQGLEVFPGEEAFKLYDTFGFPPDLTRMMARECGLTMDETTFDASMREQRERARGARDTSGFQTLMERVSNLVQQGVGSEFIGYDTLTGEGEITAILVDGNMAGKIEAPMAAAIVIDRTPFYGEAGGQVGDHGVIECDEGAFEVHDTQKPVEGVVLHLGRVTRGSLVKGAKVMARVDAGRRHETARHHTATHLLNAALREELGEEIHQAGSLVAPDRMRFDFNHFEAIDEDKLSRIERRVNDRILDDLEVKIEEMDFNEVAGKDIVALFDEKYGDRVRVVSTGNYSRELCGGTHVSRSSQIGSFRILSESSIAAGVRRIEAVCGMHAYSWARREHDIITGLCRRFSVKPEELEDRLSAMAEQCRRLEKEKRKQQEIAAQQSARSLSDRAIDIEGVKVIAEVTENQSPPALMKTLDELRNSLSSGVIVLGSNAGGKAAFAAWVSDDLLPRGLHAGELISSVARHAGGGGGGNPNKAQAGGKDGAKVPEAIGMVPDLIRKTVSF